MNYRELGAGGPYPAWVRALRGRCGVYVIRVDGFFGRELAYVGESHTGRLYQTLTRHFQRWEGPTSGPTFSRRGVEVAVRCTSAGRAVEMQNRLIRRLRPSHNVVGMPEEEVPF